MNWSSTWGLVFEHRKLDFVKEIQFGVDCIIVGDLAVHCVKELDYYITHVPTMAKFDKALPSGSRNEKDLIAWCQKVQEGCPDDWAYLRGMTNANYDDQSAQTFAVKDHLMKYCRQVRIGTHAIEEWK